jgi:hypothetical protein
MKYTYVAIIVRIEGFFWVFLGGLGGGFFEQFFFFFFFFLRVLLGQIVELLPRDVETI